MTEWELLQSKLKDRFGSSMDFDAILFMIGLQELNKPYQQYKKHEKVDIMHIAICCVLEPFNFYKYVGKDADGWPHWEATEKLPNLNSVQQHNLITSAIINYFKTTGLITPLTT